MVWTGLTPKVYCARHTFIIRPTNSQLGQPIGLERAHDRQTDMFGLGLRVPIGTGASRLRRDLNRPTNKEHVLLFIRDKTQGANRRSALKGLLYKGAP
jgi:hypothetical protein